MSRFFRWLRRNAELALVADAQEQLARKYRGPRTTGAPAEHPDYFWRAIFVPVYRRLPWQVRQRIMRAMPGSHRGWSRSTGRRTKRTV